MGPPAGCLNLTESLSLPAQEFVIPEAEAEWVGLTLDEAVEKQRLLEEKVNMWEDWRETEAWCHYLLCPPGTPQGLPSTTRRPLRLSFRGVCSTW